MKNKKLLLTGVIAAVVVVLAIIMVLAGGSQQEENAPEATSTPEINGPVDAENEAGATSEPQAEATVAEGDPADVMATVNGTAITRAVFEGYRETMLQYFYEQGYDVTNEENYEIIGGIAMETAVESAILEMKVIDLGLQITDEERAELEADNAEQWAEVVDAYAQYFLTSDEPTDEEYADAKLSAIAMLESWGYTESAMLESALESMTFEKIYAYVAEGVTVTDAEILAAYDAHVAEDQALYENDVVYYEFLTQYYGYPSYYTPEGYRGVIHILLEVDEELMNTWQSLTAQLEEQQDDEELVASGEGDEAEGAEPAAEPVTQEQVDAAYAAIIASVQPTIDEIYAKLESGTPFAELVEEYGSADPGMSTEPYKTEGYPVHMDSIVWDPAFVAGAFSVDEVGAVAEPVVGVYGVHIIQYLRDIPAGPAELTDELRATLTDELLSEKESRLFTEQLDAWKAEAEIVYSEEAAAMVAAAEAVADE